MIAKGFNSEKAKKLGRDDIWINSEIGWAYNHLINMKKLSLFRKSQRMRR